MKFYFRAIFFRLIVFCVLSTPVPFLWAAAPVISVATLFSDVIISDEYEGWTVKGVSSLSVWPQTELRQITLAKMNQAGTFILTHPLTENPVRVTEEYTEFFSDLLGVPRDGTYMAFKYVFLPKSVLTSACKEPGPPQYFYLVKALPSSVPEALQEEIEFQVPPSKEELALKIKNLESNYRLYHAAKWLNANQEQDRGRVMMLTCAKDENPQAQFDVGMIFYQQRDFRQALSYFKLAADQGHPGAQNNYGSMLQKGQGTAGHYPDYRMAQEYYRRAAEQNHAGAQNNYAYLLQRGLGMSGNAPDWVRALEYYRRAALQGLASAQFGYANMLRSGQGTPNAVPDLATAFEFYRRAAEQNHAGAQNGYAYQLRNGEGTPNSIPDLVNALEYFRRAADRGFADAQYNYAVMLQNGQGTPENIPQLEIAREYFQCAAAQRNELAIQALRSMNADSLSEDVNQDKSIRSKRKAN